MKNQKTPKSESCIYFVGIKGVAMTALALFLKERGNTVEGSDTSAIFPTDELLISSHIPVKKGFSPDNIPDNCTKVIYTGAHGGQENPEVLEAMKRGIPCVSHGVALGSYMDDYRGISIAGCHGKTTTTAMTSKILTYAGLDPSYAIGCGIVSGLGFPGHSGHGEWFVAEADEYITDPGRDMTPRFYWQKSEIFVVTNIDFDHPDVYQNLYDVQKTFTNYLQLNTKLKTLIYNENDEPSKILNLGISKNVTTYSYGEKATADFVISDIEKTRGTTSWTGIFRGKRVGRFSLRVPGIHNIYNASAALLVGYAAGITWPVLKQAIAAYEGSKRRFELIGESKTTRFYDDYAHHPTEINAILSALRTWYPHEYIVAVFQPHTYSRTQALLTEFTQSFQNVDTVIITDIYGSAREKDTGTVTGKTITDAMQNIHSDARSAPTFSQVSKILRTLKKTPDIVIFMGAGDIYNWEKHIVNQLKGMEV